MRQNYARREFEVKDRAGKLTIAADLVLNAEQLKEGKAKGRSGPGRGKAGSEAGPAFNEAPTVAELMPDLSPAKAKKTSARGLKSAKRLPS
jgi:hypothetical protein